MDDELGALRESASSPFSGEVCLEVCLAPAWEFAGRGFVSHCLHLFLVS